MKNTIKSILSGLTGLTLAAVGTITTASAATGTWHGGGGSILWTGTGNWEDGIAPNAAGDTALFDRLEIAGQGTGGISKPTIDVGNVVIGNISVYGNKSDGSGQALTLRMLANRKFTFDGGGHEAVITSAGHGALTIDAIANTGASLSIASDLRIENLTEYNQFIAIKGNLTASDNNTNVKLTLAATNERINLTHGIHGNITVVIAEVKGGNQVNLSTDGQGNGSSTYTGGTIIEDGGKVRSAVSSGFGSGDITFSAGSKGGFLDTNLANGDASVEIANNIILNGSASLGTSTGNGLTYTGVISGDGALTIHSSANGRDGNNNAKWITLAGANTYKGETIIEGRLSFASDDNLGDASGAVIIRNGGILNPTASLESNRLISLDGGIATIGVGPSVTVTFNGEISGSGTLKKDYTGILILNAANQYTGGTLVQNGVLLFNNTSGSGAGTGDVTVSSATTGGAGSVSGNMIMSAGSTLQVGYGSAGGFSIGGDLRLGGNINVIYGDRHGLLTILGTLDLGGNTMTFDLSSYTGDSELILLEVGSLSGGSFDNSSFVITGIDLDRVQFNADGITITAVPEPASYATFLAFITAAFVLMRRRKD